MATKIVTLSLIFLLALATSSEASKYQYIQKLKETNMMFYMQDWETSANATAIPVAGIPNERWWILGFGTVFATDDKLTMGIERNSSEVGRAHGIYVNSALDGSDLHLLMSLVFTNKAYNGSTFEIQGADRFYLKYREVSVVSGTGIFRLARGYATLETVFLDIPNSNAIVRWNVTVFHTTKKLAYRGGFEKLKTASIDYQTASIDMNAL
ncbi:dirigent protein 22-like [Fagus crenata]